MASKAERQRQGGRRKASDPTHFESFLSSNFRRSEPYPSLVAFYTALVVFLGALRQPRLLVHVY